MFILAPIDPGGSLYPTGGGVSRPEGLSIEARVSQWRGFTWWGAGPGGLRTEVPEWGPGAKPRYGVWAWGTKSPEDEAKCEISVQFFTFSCVKFGI